MKDELFAAWMNNEEDFHLEQAKLRSEIRLKDGRGKPIDILANYIHNAGDPDVSDVTTPPKHNGFLVNSKTLMGCAHPPSTISVLPVR